MDPLHNLITKIYGSVADCALWSDTLTEVADYLGAAGAIVFDEYNRTDGRQVVAVHSSSRYDPDLLEQYLINFNDLEILDQDSFRRACTVSNDLRLISDTEFLTSNDFATRPNVQEMKKFGLRHRAGTLLNRDIWYTDRFSLQYRENHGPITEEESDKARPLLPHLSKALSMARAFEKPATIMLGLEELTNMLPFGVCIITSKMEVIFQNREFMRLCEEHPAFGRDREGRLKLSHASGATKFHRMLTGADAHGTGKANPRREVVLFCDHDGASVVTAELSPLSSHRELGRLGQDAYLMLCLDIDRHHDIDASRVAQYFKLSNAEQEVLQLAMKGHSNAEVAEIRNISTETVKSQVSSLLQKTFSRNRTDLSRVATMLGFVLNVEDHASETELERVNNR